jgi:fructoselysine transporter
LGATSAVICMFFDLFSVIRAILAMRCLIQFVGQAFGLILLHRKWKEESWPFRMWLYPVPILLAIAGWLGIFLSTGFVPVVSSLVAMTIGLTVYMGRARMLRQWPFQQTPV